MFLDINCVDASRKRLEHIYDTFDTVCVCFSGGKDSTAMLYLAKEIHEKRGLGPVKVLYRDEEFVAPSVTKFVKEVSEYDWVDMEWYCLPTFSELFCLGQREFLLTWSAMRESEGRLFTDIPKHAITAEHFGEDRTKTISRKMDEYLMQGKSGRVAFLLGIRANESMLRYRTVVQKLHENYITRPKGLSKSIPLRLTRPIYDWGTDDVMKFVTEEHNGTFSEYYDLAYLGRANQRVGMAVHIIAARRIADVIRTEPEFYDRIIEIFPHMDGHRRLWPEYDVEKAIMSYASNGWDGVRECIENTYMTPGLKKRAMVFAHQFKQARAKDPYGYPIESCVRTLMISEIWGSPVPIGPRTRSDRLRRQDQS